METAKSVPCRGLGMTCDSLSHKNLKCKQPLSRRNDINETAILRVIVYTLVCGIIKPAICLATQKAFREKMHAPDDRMLFLRLRVAHQLRNQLHIN